MNNAIVLSRQNHLATITFSRSDKLNAFNREMSNHFEEICLEVSHDSTIRAVLLRGMGEAFMSGTDLHEVYRDLGAVSAEALTIVRQFNACILLLREMEKPVVASVHGLVMGTGMSLMLAADLVVASDNTKLSLGYNRVALSPAGGSSYLLPRIVGIKRAFELAVSTEVIDAVTAFNYGLINWVVPQEELAHKTANIIEHLVNGPTVALMQTKQLLHSSAQNKLTAQLELEAEAFVKCVNTKDFKIGVKSFVNKRISEFEGR